MRIEFVNDWLDEDGGFSYPDPFFFFNFSIGMLEVTTQVSLIFLGVGFVIFFGEPAEEV